MLRKVLVALLLTCTAAVAQPMGELRLTPNQTQGLRAIRDRFEARRQDLTLRLGQRRLELANMLRNDAGDKASVKSKLQEIMEIERERQDLFVDEYFEARQLLKPQQWNLYRRRVLRHLLNERNERGPQSPRRESY